MSAQSAIPAILLVAAVAIPPAGRRPRVPSVVLAPPSERAWARYAHEVLERASVPVDVERARALWTAAIVLGAIAGFTLAGVVGMAGGATAAVVGPPVWILSRGDRRRVRLIASLPELLELVARGLRSGADLRGALQTAAAAVDGAGGALGSALARADAGARLGDALDHWVVGLDHPDAAIVRSVLRLGDSTGAAMASALDRAAATLRERAALRDEVTALTAQTRASSTVVALAPLGFLVVVTSSDPRTAEVLFTTLWGRVCLMVGITLDAVGIIWMRRLTEGVGR